MRARCRWIGTLTLACVTVSIPLPAVCLSRPPEDRPRAEEPGRAGNDSPEPVSDAERVLRFERQIELDRERIALLQRELSERRAFFDLLIEGIRDAEDALARNATRLEELGEAGDPEQRSKLETEIEKLRLELELFKTQSNLAFTSLTTTREQIDVLEKKTEREQRALGILRGEIRPPTEPPAQEPTIGAVPGAAPPTLPGIPAAPVRPEATEGPKPSAAAETTAQIEALREVGRLEVEASRARQGLVEFVKRKESVEDELALETRLLATARSSLGNLDRALETRRTDLVRARAEPDAGVEVSRLERGIARIERMLDETRREIGERAARVDSLNRRLRQLRDEEAQVTVTAEAKRRTAEKARSRLRWLNSPFHPTQLVRWIRERGPRVLMVLVAVAVLLVLLRLTVRRIARLVVRRGRGKRAAGQNRADTLAFSFRSAMTLLLVVVGSLLVFQEAGVDVKTVLGGAAIMGVAVAFGAQNLMRDYFTGFLMLLEDQFELGDLVTIGTITGTVESVNMRVTVLRDLEGRVHFVPNGEIKSVTNRTYEWGRAVLDIPVAFEEDVDRVMQSLVEVARKLRSEPDFGEWITEEPVMLGVDRFTDCGLMIKFMLKTRPDKMFAVRRELLRRVKNQFDEQGIEFAVRRQILVDRRSGKS